MAIIWYPFPRLGTSVAAGWWLCTVTRGRVKYVEHLRLTSDSSNGSGTWEHRNGAALEDGERVVAIAFVEPASAAVVDEARRTARLLAR